MLGPQEAELVVGGHGAGGRLIFVSSHVQRRKKLDLQIFLSPLSFFSLLSSDSA